jgi:hypothetical protein
LHACSIDPAYDGAVINTAAIAVKTGFIYSPHAVIITIWRQRAIT